MGTKRRYSAWPSPGSVTQGTAGASETRGSVFKSPQVVSAIIGIIPGVLGILALLTLLLVYRNDIRRAIPRLSGVEAFGLKVSLIDYRAWSTRASKPGMPVTTGELKVAIARAKNAGQVYQGARILWADDHPENNLWERRALTWLGADVTVVLSNEETRDKVCRRDFDVLISDLQRENKENPREVAEVVSAGSNPPVIIYYAGELPDSSTPEAFRATTRPDELINLITDALERRVPAQDTN